MLQELFNGKNTSRVIEHFIVHEKWEQNQKELCEILKIYPQGMKIILKKLIDVNLLTVTRKIAKSKFYRINQRSNLLEPLRLLIQRLSAQEALKEAEKQIKVNKSSKK